MSKKKVQVLLIGQNGVRTTEVAARGGMFTRGYKLGTPDTTPLPPITSEPVTDSPVLPTTAVACVNTAEAPESNPLGDKLNALITECDSVLGVSDSHPEATPEPAPEPALAALTEGQQMIVNVLAKTVSRTLDWIARRTGLNALYIMLECRNLAEMGIVKIQSTNTARRYRLAVNTKRGVE